MTGINAPARAQKAAFVALAGRPSVGKSTLVNLLCGAKVAIVSAVPQTTRSAVRGILTRGEGQLVFVDTPGRHVSERKFNKMLMGAADRALDDAELVLYVLDASRPAGREEEAVAARLKGFQDRTAVAINKIDAAGADPQALLEFLQKSLPDIPPSRCFQISCLKKEGTGPLLDCLFDMAGEGELLYPGEYYTDQELSFRISEIIREKAMNRVREELPHSIYVEVADLELRDGPQEGGVEPEKKRLWVRAFIIVERESQKGIIVGKGGEKIKAIGQAARKELNAILDWKTDLDLRVKTGKDWRHNDRVLRKITGV
ncbi:MAG: GTPase Era [Treponema sp.]|nr:GTPase Era [Treponema sp.]